MKETDVNAKANSIGFALCCFAGFAVGGVIGDISSVSMGWKPTGPAILCSIVGLIVGVVIGLIAIRVDD